jgi:opacity protein-like surface antigen
MRLSLIALGMSLALSPLFALADNPAVSSYQSSSLAPAANPGDQDASQLSQQQNATISQALSQVTDVGDGFAVGVQTGFSQGQDRSDLNVTRKDVQTRSLEGPLAGINATYGYTFANQFYLGAEAYFNYENSWQDYTNPTFSNWTTERKIGNNFGFDLLPGYHLDQNSLLYAKLGINYADLQITNITPSSSNPYSATLPGIDLGLGFRHALTQNLSLALEYDWMYYYNEINHYAFGFPSTTIFSQNIFELSLNYQLDQIDQNASSRPSLQLTSPYIGATIGSKAQRYESSSNGVSDEWSSNGIAERLKLGYQYQVNSWFDIGAEAFTEFTQGIGAQLLGTTVNKENTGYGLSILPGYIMDPSDLLFTRLGLVRTQFEGLLHLSPTYSENVTGYQFGIGFESALTQSLSLVLEYDYTVYKGFQISHTEFNYFDNLFSLGLNYHF